MTPHQRNLYSLRDCLRFMRDRDVDASAADTSLPAWARKEYRDEAARRRSIVRNHDLVEVRA